MTNNMLNGGSGVALRMHFLIPPGKMDENGVSGKIMAFMICIIDSFPKPDLCT